MIEHLVRRSDSTIHMDVTRMVHKFGFFMERFAKLEVEID